MFIVSIHIFKKKNRKDLKKFIPIPKVFDRKYVFIVEAMKSWVKSIFVERLFILRGTGLHVLRQIYLWLEMCVLTDLISAFYY